MLKSKHNLLAAFTILCFIMGLSVIFGSDPYACNRQELFLTPTAIAFAGINGLFFIALSALKYKLKGK